MYPKIDWSFYPNFSEKEFTCSHTGKCEMHPMFLTYLQELRSIFDEPMIITSGFRDRTHSVESAKKNPGAHAYGVAADIAIQGGKGIELLKLALQLGYFTGIGIQQKGTGRFLHLDSRQLLQKAPLPYPAFWSY